MHILRPIHEGIVIFASVDQHVSLVCDQKGLMVSSGNGPYSTLLCDQSRCNFVSLCHRQARFDWIIYFIELRLVQKNFLANDFNQVIGWTETTIVFLDQSSEHIRYVMVHLVSISQFLCVSPDSADGVM